MIDVFTLHLFIANFVDQSPSYEVGDQTNTGHNNIIGVSGRSYDLQINIINFKLNIQEQICYEIGVCPYIGTIQKIN